MSYDIIRNIYFIIIRWYVTKIENHFTIPTGFGIWLVCFLVAGSTYIAKIDIGGLGIFCWAVVLIGIALWVLSFFLVE